MIVDVIYATAYEYALAIVIVVTTVLKPKSIRLKVASGLVSAIYDWEQ